MGKIRRFKRRSLFEIPESNSDNIPDLWNTISAFTLLGMKPVVPKPSGRDPHTGTPEESGLFRRSVGTPKGQVRDWRSTVPGSDSGIHVVEYRDRYEAHADRFDPSNKPLEHLIFDSGFEIAGIISIYFLSRFIFGRRK
jgi:hypothetical protein